MTEVLIENYLTGLTGRNSKIEALKLWPVRDALRSAVNRRWRHLAEERLEDIAPEIPLGERFWPLTKEERQLLHSLFETPGPIAAAWGDREENGQPVKLLDAAYWMKGCSSLGRARFAALIGIGKKRERQFRLMDIKEASVSLAPVNRGVNMPANSAVRVVTGARHLSPFLGNRMVPMSLGGRQVVVRELRPQDLKFELHGLSQIEAVQTAGLLANVVGKAHGRQLKREDRTSWRRELTRTYSKRLDAPSWLWTGIVDLVAVHEASYLRHCRDYALATARNKA